METKFTKGEWKAHKTTVSCCGGIIRQSWGPGAACCEAQRRHSEMVSANASLIASAPDLYAAVSARSQLEKNKQNGPVDMYFESSVSELERKALAKARGETKGEV